VNFLCGLERRDLSDKEKLTMKKHHVSPRKVDTLSIAVFAVALILLYVLNFWWPGILLAIWAILAVRQWLTERRFDLIMTSIILLGLFTIYFFDITWSVLMPVLFILGSFYIIFREFFYPEDIAEEKSEEIEDDANIDR
jgi:4-hydroxybenzoate polyprenyltransferase